MRGPTGKYFPLGSLLPWGKQTGGPKTHRMPSFEVLRTLPGAIEWSFFCINVHTALATFAPLNNVSPSVPAQFQMPFGSEGMITYIQIGPNVVPTSGGNGTWFPGLVFNNIPVPGWYPIASMKATDGFGNWWTDCMIPVPEGNLVQLIKLGDTLGAGNPADIGGTVHGWLWPIKSRLQWEESVGRVLSGS